MLKTSDLFCTNIANVMSGKFETWSLKGFKAFGSCYLDRHRSAKVAVEQALTPHLPQASILIELLKNAALVVVTFIED